MSLTRKKLRPSITITAIYLVGVVVVFLGAVSAIFGIGSAAFSGKIGSLQITTTSAGLVLVIAGLVYLYKMTKLIKGGIH